MSGEVDPFDRLCRLLLVVQLIPRVFRLVAVPHGAGLSLSHQIALVARLTILIVILLLHFVDLGSNRLILLSREVLTETVFLYRFVSIIAICVKLLE